MSRDVVIYPHFQTQLLSLDLLSRLHVWFRTVIYLAMLGGRDAHIVFGLGTCNYYH
jgi:hypothetical protein